MRLRILTPERIVLDEDQVESVTARMTEGESGGEFGVLPRHIPLVAPLAVASLSYVKRGQKTTAAVMGGMFSTDGESVTVLSTAAELTDEIDAVRAQHARDRAEARLRERTETMDLQRAELALSRALLRLKLAGKA